LLVERRIRRNKVKIKYLVPLAGAYWAVEDNHRNSMEILMANFALGIISMLVAIVLFAL
jgi:mannitol-specific phosphotransferase system IIBC component